MTEKMHINWDMIVRRILGESSTEENVLVEKWLEEDEQNREYYRKAKRYFDVYYTGEEVREVDAESAWDEFVDYAGKSSRRGMWRAVLKYAAVLIILIGVGGIYWMQRAESPKMVPVVQSVPIEPGTMKAVLVFNSGVQVNLTDTTALERVVEEFKARKDVIEEDSDQVEYNTIVVPRGGEFHLTLADGTHVKLNAESKLRIPEKFAGKERRVSLEGEALFQVTRDTAQPFIVETRGGEVKVLGTEFNLKAYPDEECVQTTLVEGKVAFQGKGMTGERVILPGDQITYDVETHAVNVEKVNTKIYTAWTEGKWIIEGERLEDILKQLSRWYDVSVFYRNPEVKDLVFTGDLEKYKNCNVILDIISMTTNVEFELKNRVIVVKMR